MPNTIRLLTPPGHGAIATLELRGPTAWEAVRMHFRPATGELPALPISSRFWFGNLGEGFGDEVILTAKSVEPPTFEIHCHGGPQVIRMIAGLFGGELSSAPNPPSLSELALQLLPRATTLKTASILLDQSNGAFERAIQAGKFERLVQLIPVGRHLLMPFTVAIVGPPNAGKSSLMNALAGFERSVVAPIPGTTRDVVRVPVAFDGWPVELLDTAGLRETESGLEAEGIERAKRSASEVDLVLELFDATERGTSGEALPNRIRVGNKCDLLTAEPTGFDLLISATTGAGLPELIRMIVNRLVPHPPIPGEAVPFTPELCEAVERGKIEFCA